MITDDQAEKAADWLRDNAEEAAQARAERLYLEAWVKTVLAQQMKQWHDLPVSAQEREARASAPYIAALQGMKEAIAIDERYKFLREAASAKLDAWRTMESTRRAEGRQ